MALNVKSYSTSVIAEIPHKRAEKNNKREFSALMEKMQAEHKAESSCGQILRGSRGRNHSFCFWLCELTQNQIDQQVCSMQCVCSGWPSICSH